MKTPARERLAILPTPLHEMPKLGAALGGNKVRKLEYFLADALAVSVHGDQMRPAPRATKRLIVLELLSPLSH